jgi:hypothetical protein
LVEASVVDSKVQFEAEGMSLSRRFRKATDWLNLESGMAAYGTRGTNGKSKQSIIPSDSPFE